MSPATNNWRRFYPLLIFVVFALAFFRFWNHSLIFRDSFQYFAPDKFLIRSALTSGQIYAWNPWLFCGMPFVADVQAGWFYPLNIFYLILPFSVAHRLFILIHYPLAGLFMFLFLRGRGLDAESSLLGGLAFPFSGYLISQSANVAFVIGPALAPLALFCFDRSLWKGIVWALACGASLAMMVFGGEPQSAAITAVIIGGIALSHFISGPDRLRVLGLLLATALSSLLFSAVQVWPSAEMTALSLRAPGFSFFKSTEFSFHPARLIELIWPTAFGAPTPEFHYFGDFTLEESLRHINQVPWSVTEYVGLPLLLLAGVGLLASRRKIRWALAAGFIFFLSLAFGRHLPVYGWLYELMAFFKMFRYPEKYMGFWTTFCVVAAALGLERVKEIATERPESLKWPALIYLVGVALGAMLATLLWPWVLLGPAGLSPGSPELEIAQDHLFWSGVQWTVVNLVAGVLTLLVGLSRLRFSRALLIFFPLLVGDWTLANVNTMSAGPAEVFNFRPLAARAISPAGPPALGHFRILRIPMIYQDPWPVPSRYSAFERQRLWERHTLLENLAAMENLESLFGYHPSELLLGRELFRGKLEPRLLEIYNVEYVIHSFRDSPLPGLHTERVFASRDHDLTVTRLPNTFPRAYFVNQAFLAKNEAEAIRLVKSRDLRTGVVLTTEEKFETMPVAGPVFLPAQIRRYEPNEVEIEITAPTAGFLVLSDRFYPGWQATVNGQPQKIYLANVFVRAVRVAAGKNVVRFSFHSWPFQAGAIVSLLAWSLAFIVWIYRGIKTRRSPPATSPPR